MSIIVLLAIALTAAESARILVIIPTPFYSHVKFGKIIYDELANRGHNIVAFVPRIGNPKELAKNVEEIDIIYNNTAPAFKFLFTLNNALIKYHMGEFYDATCEYMYSNVRMQQLLKNPAERFDLVIIEWNVTPCFSVLAEHFGTPLIGLRSLGLRPEGHDFIGNPTNPVIYDNLNPNFLGRFKTFMFSVFWRIHFYVTSVPRSRKVVKKYFPKIDKDVLTLEKQVAVVITNTNRFINGVRPVVPGNIEVDSIHVGKDNVKLDKDLKSYLDSSKNGFILFSTGTLIDSDVFENKLTEIFEAFQNLPYNFVWKSKLMPVGKIPDNVKVWKWLPQETVLAHPNIKCLISHGGLLSIQEAVYQKVPLIVIPFLFDQPMNAHYVERLGIGMKLTMDDLNKNSLSQVINEVVENPRYALNMNEISRLFADQPMKSLDKAIWWIEYVIRNKGYPHGRSKSVHMNWITYLLLDVIIFSLSAIFLMVMTIKWFLNKFITCGKYCKTHKLKST